MHYPKSSRTNRLLFNASTAAQTRFSRQALRLPSRNCVTKNIRRKKHENQKMLQKTNNRQFHRKPKFQAHVRAHEAITSNESLHSNKPPNLGQGFSVAETAERRTTVMEILLRAAKRAQKDEDTDLAEAFYQVYDRLEACRPFGRCLW
jgi:hypothetical protein